MITLMKFHDNQGGVSNHAIDMDKASMLIIHIVRDAIGEGDMLDLKLGKYFSPQELSRLKFNHDLEPDDEYDITEHFYDDLKACSVEPPYEVEKEITVFEGD